VNRGRSAPSLVVSITGYASRSSSCSSRRSIKYLSTSNTCPPQIPWSGRRCTRQKGSSSPVVRDCISAPDDERPLGSHASHRGCRGPFAGRSLAPAVDSGTPGAVWLGASLKTSWVTVGAPITPPGQGDPRAGHRRCLCQALRPSFHFFLDSVATIKAPSFREMYLIGDSVNRGNLPPSSRRKLKAKNFAKIVHLDHVANATTSHNAS
jgi:hypothetical protein